MATKGQKLKRKREARKAGILPQEREPNGRVKRAGSSERREDVRKVAAEQPHRLGSTDPMRASAIGCMIQDEWREWFPHGDPAWTQRELFDAAERYREAWARVRALMGSKRPFALVSETGDDPGWDDDQWRQYRLRCELAFREARNAIGSIHSIRVKAAETAILDEIAPPFQFAWWIRHSMLYALCSLAEHYASGKK